MAKNRKKVFPKPPQRLNSHSVKLLGKNSNTMQEFYHEALYNRPEPKKQLGSTLTPKQIKQLESLKRNLQKVG